MKWRGLALILVAGLATSAFAQTYQPRHKALLTQALTASADGSCPSAIMAPTLQYQCEKQLPAMQAAFAQLGPIQSVTFRGNQATPSGPAEVYLVKFRNGEMMWMAAADTDGKLYILWSPG